MSDEEEIIDGDEEDVAPETPPEQTVNDDDDIEFTEKELKIDEPDDLDDEPYWPVDWREAAAEMASAGDKKAYKQELKRLERLRDPTAIYSMYRELESRMSGEGMLKIPDDDATEEDIKAYHAALGVPESPEDYLTALDHWDNGDAIDVDDEEINSLAGLMHEFGATEDVAHAVLNYVHESNVRAAEEEVEEDDNYRWETERMLKDEFGPSYKRTINNIGQLFRYAPGGTDMDNEDSLRARLLGGRLADGARIGDDPDMIRFLASLSQEIDPVATVMDTTAAGGKGIDQEISEIEKYMREDRKAYSKDEAVQQRYRDLMDAKLRAKAREG